jgi:hypothetical protein
MVGQLAKRWGAKRVIGTTSQGDRCKTTATEPAVSFPSAPPLHSHAPFLSARVCVLVAVVCCWRADTADKCKVAKEKFSYAECIDESRFNTHDKMRDELKRISPEGFDLFWVSTRRTHTHSLEIQSARNLHWCSPVLCRWFHLLSRCCV